MMENSAETTEQVKPQVAPGTYTLAFLFSCESCGHLHAITDVGLIGAAIRGQGVRISCQKCNHAHQLRPPQAPDAPRIVVPGVAMNRHARRAQAVAKVVR